MLIELTLIQLRYNNVEEEMEEVRTPTIFNIFDIARIEERVAGGCDLRTTRGDLIVAESYGHIYNKTQSKGVLL